MKWKTKAGKEMDVEDMEDSHAQNCINMLIRNTSPQLILDCILQGREDLLKKRKSSVDLLTINLPTLSGDMAQQFNDTYPGDEEDSLNIEFDPNWYKEGFG